MEGDHELLDPLGPLLANRTLVSFYDLVNPHPKASFRTLNMLPLFNMLLLFPAALYAAVLPSPASISQNRFNVSGFSGEPAYCVNTGKYPNWNGRILHADCVQALTYLKLHSADYSSIIYGFYSDEGGFRPPPSRSGDKGLNWRLPTTTIHRKQRTRREIM